MIANSTVLVIIAIPTFHENPVIATPSAVPAAGGCSMSNTTIASIVVPTANENTIIERKWKGWGIIAQNEPNASPIQCPPIIARFLAETALGIVKTINIDAAIDATTTAFSKLSANKIIIVAIVAAKLW